MRGPKTRLPPGTRRGRGRDIFRQQEGPAPGTHQRAGPGKRGKVSCKTPAESCSLSLLGTKVRGHTLKTAWLVLTTLTPWPSAANLSLTLLSPLYRAQRLVFLSFPPSITLSLG